MPECAFCGQPLPPGRLTSCSRECAIKHRSPKANRASIVKHLKRHSEIDAATSRPGIYLFVHGDEIVYVGQSKKPLKRVGQHKIKFDTIAVIPVPIEELNKVERAFIRTLRPG